MKIVFDKKQGEKLANLLCEIDALIHDGTIKVGFVGLSENAANDCHIFDKFINNNPPGTTEIIIPDNNSLSAQSEDK